jgi:hypothetical protein
MAKTPVATKGTSITIGIDDKEIKAILVSDLDIDPGEASVVKTAASDGSKYSLAGDESESVISGDVLITSEDFASVMNSIYGTGSVVGTSTTWDMSEAGGTVNDVVITTPTFGSSTTNKVTYTLVNAKGLTAKPVMQLENHWQMSIKYTGDYMTGKYTS